MADRLVVVVSPGADAVRDVAAADDVVFVDQVEQLGTGHAVSCALAEIDHADRIVVLYGDVPLLRPETLARLVKDVPAGALGIVTAEVADPFGFGRMVRDETGRVCRIVEEKDASSAERAIRESKGSGRAPGRNPEQREWKASIPTDLSPWRRKGVWRLSLPQVKKGRHQRGTCCA